MFEKNDKQLLTMRILLNVVTFIFVLAGIISGIILLVNDSIALGLVMLLLVPFLSWLMWVVARLFLTYLCDIKLIRNKLYGVNNDNLKVFLEENESTPATQSTNNSPTQRVSNVQAGNTNNTFNYVINHGMVTLTRINYLFPKIIIPEQIDGMPVVDLSEGLFPDNIIIEKVVINAQITKLHSKMFAKCKNLTEIELPASLTVIEDGAFKGCKKLTSITLPNTLNTIGDDAFANCINLRKIIIPYSVRNIGYSAFYGCDNLIIYAEAKEKPNTWKQDWNSMERPVLWGYNGNS